MDHGSPRCVAIPGSGPSDPPAVRSSCRPSAGGPMRSTPSRVLVPAAVAAVLLLAGCSSTVTGTPAPTGGNPSLPSGIAEAEQQGEDLVEGGAPDENFDVCALL